MNDLLEQNKKLIIKEIEILSKEIKKIDNKIIKESELCFQQGRVDPRALEKISTWKIEREKLLYTQSALYSVLGQWKEK
ncbi:hypothetical protein NDS46_29930 (plasmid) [Paenibacillus thiaminolyticus]|uniref:hypothetical protein n=1 Tax=Paenibacillus thiaminolyticus TaxID=49283 RepID=UPI00232E7992|nr:hypothetical protein [Paenibacillus thiaminolyticus]WCF11568.1 hypothetical protein NDS46_29930 [Paenibacillus thiaminolyticus]